MKTPKNCNSDGLLYFDNSNQVDPNNFVKIIINENESNIDKNKNLENCKSKYLNLFFTEIRGIMGISNLIKRKKKYSVKKRITPTFLAPLSKKEKYLEFLMFEKQYR